MKKSSFAVLLAVLPMLFVLPCHSVYAQSGRNMANARQGYLTLVQAKTFQSALHMVSEKAHVCLLAENAPLRDTLTEAEAQKLVGVFTLDEMLPRLAAAYDYEVEGWHGRDTAKARSGGAPTIYLFRKKYTDKHDLPDVTFDECRLLFREMGAMVKPYTSFPPIQSNTNGTLDVADALSADQLKQMAIGDGIPIRDLRPEQQKLVWRLALYSYVDLSTISLTEAMPYLDKAEAKGEVVQEAMPQHPYNQAWPVGTPVYAVTIPNEATRPFNSNFYTFVPCCSVNILTPESADKTKEVKLHLPPALSLNTLAMMVADCARRAPDLQVRLDNAIANRHVSPFGSSFAAPVDQMYALASLLDMQLQHRTDKEYQLSRPRPRDPRDVSQLFQIIRGSLLPGSLRRYFSLGPPIDPNRRPDTPLPPMPLQQETDSQATEGKGFRAVYAAYVVRETMRPALRQALLQTKDVSAPLKFAALDENTKGLFGLLWVLDRLMPTFLNLPLDTPGHISHFHDDVSLRGGWHGEEPKRFFDAMFVYHPAPGKTTGAGFRVGSKRFKE